MWNPLNNNLKQSRPRMINDSNEGCKIKVKRDSQGRVSAIETNGKCKKEEVELFRQNMSFGEDQEFEED